MKQIRRTKEDNRIICEKIKELRKNMTFIQIAAEFKKNWENWGMKGELLKESSLRKLYKSYEAGDFDDDEISPDLIEAVTDECNMLAEETETHTCYISSWDDEGQWMPSVKIEVEIPANLKQEHKELVRDYELAIKLKREWL